MPKISVVVPAHNMEDYLDKCLESIVKQTYKDIEIICVNDHSEDKTEEMLAEWAKKDDRIIVLKSEKRGLSAARNCGIERAKGEFLMFCDSDDSFEPSMCEDMLKVIEKSGASIAICEMNFIYEAYRERQLYDEYYCNLHFAGLQKIQKSLFSQISVYAFNKIYRMSLVNKYELRFPEGRYYEDAYFTFAYMCVSDSMYFLQKRLYNYVRRRGSIMATTWSKKNTKDVAIDHVHVIIDWYDFLKKHELFDEFGEVFWVQFLTYLDLAIGICKSKAAKMKIYELAAKFIEEHPEDYTKANVDTKGGLVNAIPQLRRKSLSRVKRMLLRFMPAYAIQIENTRRMNELIKHNAELTKMIKDLSSSRK